MLEQFSDCCCAVFAGFLWPYFQDPRGTQRAEEPSWHSWWPLQVMSEVSVFWGAGGECVGGVEGEGHCSSGWKVVLGWGGGGDCSGGWRVGVGGDSGGWGGGGGGDCSGGWRVVLVGGSTVSMHSRASPHCQLHPFDSCRFVQRAPLSFLQSAMCKPLLCCAIAACSLDHKDANASVMKFLSDFIKCAREKEVRGRIQMASGSGAHHLYLKGTEETCKCSITGLSQQTVPPEEKC